ncbi:14-3-3 protein epsilon-like [Clavelina lepadiformis]|uniref:14-3-3 domain-containing protein n=1 Tax=Clavelina lepadiformis TaxID=159417 RepID=A0ABP0GLJ4_CLALP
MSIMGQAAQTNKEKCIFEAKMAEKAERYQDLVEYMKPVVMSGEKLSREERNLWSLGYKNLVGARRSSWITLEELRQKREYDRSAMERYQEHIDNELTDITNEVIDLIDQHILPLYSGCEEDDLEAKVYFMKMKGDYYRYSAECKKEEDRKLAAENSLQAYKSASDQATSSLKPTHPIRLGLALNFSVFYYEILNLPDRAFTLAKSAFDAAIAELDTLPEDSYKDTTLSMQLLRDNLTLWTSDMQAEEVNPDQQREDVEDLEHADAS